MMLILAQRGDLQLKTPFESFFQFGLYRTKWENNNDFRIFNKDEAIHALSCLLFF